MKKKFIIFTLCFSIIFSSINYKKSYAFDGGIVSAPLLATLSSVVVASGVVLSSNDDVQDLGKIFYDKYKDRWDEVNQVFDLVVTIGANKVVTVGKEFLTLVKECFDSIFPAFDSTSSSSINVSRYGSVPCFPSYSVAKYYLDSMPSFSNPLGINSFNFNGTTFTLDTDKTTTNSNGTFYYYKYDSIHGVGTGVLNLPSYFSSFKVFYNLAEKRIYLFGLKNNQWEGVGYSYTPSNYIDTYDIPYVPGSYSPGGVLDNDKLDVYVPGNSSSLVGSLPSDVVVGDTFNPPYELPNGGVVTVPGVSNPSIDVDNSISFPNVGDVPDVDNPSIPNDTPFANITEYIIGLVVPSDSYWTDTFGGLYNNFTSSFPMVDMEGFKDLVTGEKKFPNIDINIMGVKGRVVNGDVINSIVDWLRPIIAGFMMLCLMLFNYRKIYKTIRGVEPFQGIAQGTSDFRTGISEYNYMGSGLSKSDYEANERELAKALHDHYEDTGKTYKVRI